MIELAGIRQDLGDRITYLEGYGSRVVILDPQDLRDLLVERATKAQLSWFNFDRHDVEVVE